MTTTLWATLPRPILGLAPMNGISDHPFRHIQKKHGRPHIVYTEFTAVERLGSGDADLLEDFRYDESQRPIIGQIYGRTPALFRRMALLLCELGFDGIDINMGCPSPSVVHRGAGAGLIRTPDLALEILAATRQGIRDWQDGRRLRDDSGVPAHIRAAVEARHARLPAAHRVPRPIPVSVKTRIGYETPAVASWIPRLLEGAPAALALHGRTLRQGYAGQADWDQIGRAAEYARSAGVPILGNGDVASHADAHARTREYGLDGVLIGRASYGNPFVFGPVSAPAPRRLLEIAREHARLYEATFVTHSRYRFLPMRKHLSWYVRGVPSASHVRRALIETWSAAEAEAILDEALARLDARRAGAPAAA